MEQDFVVFKCFKWKCNKCRRIRHKAANCQSGGAGGARCNNNNDNVHEGNGGGVNRDTNHEHLCKENCCFYCKERGHIAKHCRANQQEKIGANGLEAANSAVDTDNIVFMAVEGHKKLTNDTWVTDSGATCHITNSLDGMFDIKSVHESVKIGMGEETYATKCGKYCGEVMTPGGKKEVIFSGVRYIPGFYVELFSVTSAMKNGAKIASKGMQLMVENGPMKLIFQKCLEMKSSFVLDLRLSPRQANLQGMQGKVKKWMQRNGTGCWDTSPTTLCTIRPTTTKKQWKNSKIARTA